MKRCLRLFVVCAVVLVMATVAAAQQKPEPVIRLGDWVEIGNEAFMNIIASGDMRFNNSHNLDFEDRLRDRSNNRDPFDTSMHDQEGDHLYVEARLGADFRYQKNFRFQILFEWQGTLDGNLIDDRHNDLNPGGDDAFGRDAVTEDESTNLERIWMQYTFEGTPLRIHIGADLWSSDQAGMISDDDPRFGFYLDLPNDLEIGAWAVLQTTSQRLGLQNDHDFWYYVGHMAFKGAKPFVFGLDAVYFRDRSNLTPAVFQGLAFRGQKTDSVLIMPSASGSFGPITFLVQPMLLFGHVDSCNSTTSGCATPKPGDIGYDVFSWGGVAYLEANLAVVRPFVGLVIGSGDDDATDNDLEGFATFPQREITIMSGSRFYEHLDASTAFGSRDVITPARNAAVAGGGALFGGQEFSHTVGNPFNDRIANFAHPGINHTYGNPGTLLIPAGVKIAPLPGHEAVLAYIYRAMMETDIVEAALGVDVSKTLYHEIFFQWEWVLSRHFDIRLSGSVLLPGEGSKDIAQVSTTENCATGEGCEGEDIGFKGQARFRARF
jgi:hypothetical protein